MNLRPALCLPLLVLPLSACSATMSLSRYEGVTGVSWPQISVGQRVLIAPGPACDLRSGDGLASALGADKAPTSFHTAGAVVTVEQAVVNPHSERIGLAVRGDEKTEFVSVSFASKDCFYPPEIEGLARAKEAIGKRYAFTPWMLHRRDGERSEREFPALRGRRRRGHGRQGADPEARGRGAPADAVGRLLGVVRRAALEQYVTEPK